MKVTYVLTLFSLFFFSCKQQVAENQNSRAAPNFQASSCNIGKWSSSSLPLNLKLAPEFISDFTNADLINGLNPIERMAKVWNDAVTPTATLFQVPFTAASNNGSAALTSFHDGELGIYKSHTWFNNVSSSALAITQFYGVLRSNGSLGTYIDLTHADIILNYRDFGSDFSYTGNSFIDYDIPTIVLHEMGHFLGLCHESNNSSVMAPYYLAPQRSLKTFDTNKISALYINNQNLGVNALSIKKANALSIPVGTEVKGIIELSANGVCKHYLNGKLTHQHIKNKKAP